MLVRVHLCFTLFVSAAVTAGAAQPTRLVRVETDARTDSITVGERFTVRHIFTYPDSLSMLPPDDINPGTCRIIDFDWKDSKAGEFIQREAAITVITLDLEAAFIPQMEVDFVGPEGDTVTATTREVSVPVRRMVVGAADPKPLKEQWEAPRSYFWWIVGTATAVLVAVAVWLWLRHRKRRPVVEPQRPRLPTDYVALTELTRIEKLGLLDQNEFKRYYTLVVDAVRHYLEDRFEIEAMDRTSTELLGDLEAHKIHIDKLEPLLTGADLVKFAKVTPSVETGKDTMQVARHIVVNTAPRYVEPVDEDGPSVAEAGN